MELERIPRDLNKVRSWSPKRDETYRNFNRGRFYDQNGNDLGFAASMIMEGHDEYRVNRVYFIDTEKNRRPCTFEIDEDGEVEIRMKEKMDGREKLFEKNFCQGIESFSLKSLAREDKPSYQTGKYLGIETKETRHYSMENLEFTKRAKTEKVDGFDISEEYNYYIYTVREKKENPKSN